MLLRFYHFIYDILWRFSEDDGWAIASYIALSALMSLFPFLIFVTALAGFLDFRPLADETIHLMFEILAQAGGRADRAGDPVRHQPGAHRRADLRRGARHLLLLQRHREPAHRPQPRLRRAGGAGVVPAAPRIHRLCADRRGGDAGAVVPGGAGPAPVADGGGAHSPARALLPAGDHGALRRHHGDPGGGAGGGAPVAAGGRAHPARGRPGW